MTDAGGGGSGSGKPKPPVDDKKIPTTDKEIIAQITRKLGPHIGAINDCVDKHKDSVAAAPTELVLAVKASGKATAKVEPSAVDASALGACIRSVAQSIDYGRIASDITIHQKLRQQ